jgi:hypothetical protein
LLRDCGGIEDGGRVSKDAWCALQYLAQAPNPTPYTLNPDPSTLNPNVAGAQLLLLVCPPRASSTLPQDGAACGGAAGGPCAGAHRVFACSLGPTCANSACSHRSPSSPPATHVRACFVSNELATCSMLHRLSSARNVSVSMCACVLARTGTVRTRAHTHAHGHTACTIHAPDRRVGEKMKAWRRTAMNATRARLLLDAHVHSVSPILMLPPSRRQLLASLSFCLSF